jgi:hypothetical protein
MPGGVLVMALEKFDHGPLIAYEVCWNNGHVETIMAHQVILPSSSIFGGRSWSDDQVMLHGEIDGRWQLLLCVNASEIKSVRNVTRTEAL